MNCAFVSCPNRSRVAYTGSNFDELADAGARAYVNSPRAVRVDTDRLHVSSIYLWFKADFGESDAGIIAHLRQFAAPTLAARLGSTTRVASDSYDWSLTDRE